MPTEQTMGGIRPASHAQVKYGPVGFCCCGFCKVRYSGWQAGLSDYWGCSGFADSFSAMRTPGVISGQQREDVARSVKHLIA